MSVLILAALPEELAGLRRSMAEDAPGAEGTRRGRIAGAAVTLAVLGDGARGAARRARALLEAIEPPELVVLAGFAGALSPELEVGSVVVARRVVAWGPSGAPQPALEAPRGPREAALVASGARDVVAVSAQALVATAAEKRAMAARLGEGPAVVDLESRAVLEAVAARRLPWLLLRAVSDGADESLPEVLTRSASSDGAVNRAALIARALTRPTAWLSLARLAQRARRGSDALAAALSAALAARG